MGGVRAKIGLTGQLDRRQPGNYFKPCNGETRALFWYLPLLLLLVVVVGGLKIVFVLMFFQRRIIIIMLIIYGINTTSVTSL